jgi:hypothetical protein
MLAYKPTFRSSSARRQSNGCTLGWQAAFNSFIWPLLGFIFVPWTTLMYVLVASGGVVGFDWIWLGLAVLADVGMYAGGGYGNRDRILGYGG